MTDKSGVHAHHKICAIEISGGFLDGAKFEFSDGLNCIIGGRGTGKTTVLEFLRYALNALPSIQQAPAQHKQIMKLVEGNLGDGTLKVTVETKEGLPFVIQKGADGDYEVLDEESEVTEVTPETVVDIDVYSQNEIEEIANTPHFQLNLIDKFVKGEISDIQNALRTVRRDLAHNASEIVKLKGEILELSQGQSEVKLLEAKLQKLQPAGNAARNELQNEISKKALRDKETRFAINLPIYLAKLANDIDAIRTPFEAKSGDIIRYFNSSLSTGDNKAFFSDLSQKFATNSDVANKNLIAAVEALKKLHGEVVSAIPLLEQAHQTQDQKYQVLLKKNEAERGMAQEQAVLQKRLNELHDKARESKEKKSIIDLKYADRNALLKKLSESRDARWKLRQQVAKELNEHLEPTIRIMVDACGDRTAYRDRLREMLKGKNIWYSALVDKIVSTIPPADFTVLVQDNNKNELIERLDMPEEKIEWLIAQLRDTEVIYELETVEVEDKPIIQLKDGDYKDAGALSIGQKCTTILPILLWGSTNPLLVDQPEDNLDNNFIYETVVKRILAAKKDRQLIFVTHNPNIPVLGDASRVFVLKSDGHKSGVAAAGTVDNMRAHIEKFLEGGREAFTKRKEIYGIK